MVLNPLPVNKLVNKKVYHVYDPSAHTYFPAKWDSKSKYFDTLMDRISPYLQRLAQVHYSPINRELIMDEDIRKTCGVPCYVITEAQYE